jgi:hypothetical protein
MFCNKVGFRGAHASPLYPKTWPFRANVTGSSEALGNNSVRAGADTAKVQQTSDRAAVNPGPLFTTAFEGIAASQSAHRHPHGALQVQGLAQQGSLRTKPQDSHTSLTARAGFRVAGQPASP